MYWTNCHCTRSIFCNESLNHSLVACFEINSLIHQSTGTSSGNRSFCCRTQHWCFTLTANGFIKYREQFHVAFPVVHQFLQLFPEKNKSIAQGAKNIDTCAACPAGTIGENLGSTSVENCAACLPGRCFPKRDTLHIFASIECIIDFLQHVLHSTLGLLKLLKIFSPKTRNSCAGGAMQRDRAGSAIAPSAPAALRFPTTRNSELVVSLR